MTRCAECGQVECDKESCPGWSVDRNELQEALIGGPLMNVLPVVDHPLFDRTWTEESLKARSVSLEPLFMTCATAFSHEKPADRCLFDAQFQQLLPNSCCQRNRDGRCCEHACLCNRQKCRWDGR